jgi:hypothetical protein
MRALILIAAALSLAACKNNSQVDNTQNVDESLTAENIVSNDVTAIDAVTGDASNMAAESDINDIGAANIPNSGGNMPMPTKPKRPRATAPAGETGNTVSGTAANATD